MNTLTWAVQSAKRRGVLPTTRIALNVLLDLHFDWRYGTDTLRWVEIADLEHDGDEKFDSARHRSPYRATKVRPLLKLLQQLRLPRDGVFVDIGSGKGRVLLIASQYGFRKVIGIEFSGALCAIARRNVDVFSKKAAVLSRIEVLEADATKYRFQPDESVRFMFNPFDAFILGQVVQSIRRSLQEHPRKLCLIYNTPRYHEVIKNAGLFASDTFYDIGGNQFRVYTN